MIFQVSTANNVSIYEAEGEEKVDTAEQANIISLKEYVRHS